MVRQAVTYVSVVAVLYRVAEVMKSALARTTADHLLCERNGNGRDYRQSGHGTARAHRRGHDGLQSRAERDERRLRGGRQVRCASRWAANSASAGERAAARRHRRRRRAGQSGRRDHRTELRDRLCGPQRRLQSAGARTGRAGGAHQRPQRRDRADAGICWRSPA